MRSLLARPLALPWALALAFATVLLFAGSQDVFWTGDFYLEVYPAYERLMGGDVGGFFEVLPGYSGFTVLVGAPAALLTGALGGIETMVFRLTAAPGLLALAALGVAVAGPVRAGGNRAWPVFLLAAAGGALAYETLRYGHPEDLLATGCAVGAVLAARSGRIGWASVLVVLAVVAKQWAVLAILPAALAAPRRGWWIAAVGAIATVVLVGLQTQLGNGNHEAITSTGLLFHPHQVFWPFGIPATPEFIAGGHGTRMGPEWLAPLTRPLIVGSGIALAVAWWLRGGAERNRDDALGVLALAMLLRCMLDPWNLVYYQLPLAVCLAAWEARRGRDVPVLSVVVNAACWLTFITYDARSGYGPYVAYLAWTVPLAVGLGVTLLRRPTRQRSAATAAAAVPAPA
jgi:Glycosyltransferase family 87